MPQGIVQVHSACAFILLYLACTAATSNRQDTKFYNSGPSMHNLLHPPTWSACAAAAYVAMWPTLLLPPGWLQGALQVTTVPGN